MNRSKEMVLGIDFGTSYSSAAVLINGKVEWVIDRGDAMIPSIVYLPKGGTPQIGIAAQMRLAVDSAHTVQSIKRILGRQYDDSEVRILDAGVGYRLSAGPRGLAMLTVGKETFACEQIVAMVLRYLRDLAEARFGTRIKKAIIAVPAESEASYVTALRRAAKIAHLELLQVIPEPIAGALSMGMHGESCERRFAVCDFGGGTFDATLIEQSGLHFTPVACCGDTRLGGDDFDFILASEIADSVSRKSKYNMRNDVVRWQLLQQRCESVKRILSKNTEARLSMKDAYMDGGKLCKIDVLIDREWAESRWAPLLERMSAVLARLLQSSGWEKQDVQEVVLIGGTSVIPCVRRSISEFFEKEHLQTNELANVAVAYGATLQTQGHLAVRTQLPTLHMK